MGRASAGSYGVAGTAFGELTHPRSGQATSPAITLQLLPRGAGEPPETSARRKCRLPNRHNGQTNVRLVEDWREASEERSWPTPADRIAGSSAHGRIRASADATDSRDRRSQSSDMPGTGWPDSNPRPTVGFGARSAGHGFESASPPTSRPTPDLTRLRSPSRQRTPRRAHRHLRRFEVRRHRRRCRRIKKTDSQAGGRYTARRTAIRHVGILDRCPPTLAQAPDPRRAATAADRITERFGRRTADPERTNPPHKSGH